VSLLFSHSRKDLFAGIDTKGGFLCIEFPRSGWKALPFAKSLMMTVSRLEAQVDIEHGDIAPPVFDTTDLKGLPLMSNETPFDIIRGKSVYFPCCLIKSTPPTYL